MPTLTDKIKRFFKVTYFRDQDKGTFITPSVEMNEDTTFEITLDVSNLKQNFKLYTNRGTDYEDVYLTQLQDDPVVIEILRFLAMMRYAQRLQVNYYVPSAIEELSDMPEGVRNKRIKKALDKLWNLRLINKWYKHDKNGVKNPIPFYGLTAHGKGLIIHLRSVLKFNFHIEPIYDDELSKMQPKVYERAWKTVDAYLALHALQNYRGFKNHYKGAFNENDEYFKLYTSSGVLSVELREGLLLSIITYTPMLSNEDGQQDKHRYLEGVFRSWSKFYQEFAMKKPNNLKSQFNALGLIVSTESEARKIVEQYQAEALSFQPIFMVLEKVQKQGVEKAFVIWEDGEFKDISKVFNGTELLKAPAAKIEEVEVMPQPVQVITQEVTDGDEKEQKDDLGFDLDLDFGGAGV